MADKQIVLRWGDGDVPVTLRRAVRREDLYGKPTKTVEIGGQVLEKVLLDPEGRVFMPSDVTHLPTDSDGSISEWLVRTEDGEILQEQPSSFKQTRPLREAGIEELARLRVDSVFSIQSDLPPGHYCTEFTYYDSAVPKDAILIVTPSGAAFLLTGTFVDAPLQRRGDVYSFFDEPDEDPDEDASDDDGICFAML